MSRSRSRSENVPDDWADRWRDFHEPVWIADRVLIRPSWESVQREAAVDVVIDPGQAFGTGAHPTTRMCIELLLQLADAGEAGGSLADLGTGSGVLAIAAAKLGWSPVVAVDHEVAAVEAGAANAVANAVEIEPRRVNLREQPPPSARTVVANLTAPLLLEVSTRLESPPEALICSGLLEREVDEVVSAFEQAGLRPVDRLTQGDWAAVGFCS